VRRRINTASGETFPSLDFLSSHEDNRRVYGWHTYHLGNNHASTIPLTRDVLNDIDDAEIVGVSLEETRILREELQSTFLCLYIYRHLRSRPVSDDQTRLLVEDLRRDGGFSAENISLAITRNNTASLRMAIEIWIATQQNLTERPIGEIITDPLILEEIDRARQTSNEQETVEETESEDSWRGDGDDSDNKEGQSLLNLLYRIAEGQARRDGFVHRGITCNSCGAYPIKGIRYRCANCTDFDLCEACESSQTHPKTHIFYKVRIPRSHMGHQAQQIKYPGKYPRTSRGLSRDRVNYFAKETGYKIPEVEGLWEQFRCLAATDWPADPLPHRLAIDRRTFEQIFLPTNWKRPPPPSIIYDRVFSFYDTNNDNLIGFEELIVGLSNLNKRGPTEKWARIFKGFDIDGDGLVNRKDFLRMFKAHYALTKEMTRELIAGMEEESNEEDVRDLITGGQPLSSAFTHCSPLGQNSRAGEGKDVDSFGDLIVHDEKGAIDDVDGDDLDIDEIVTKRAEAKAHIMPVGKGTDVQAMIHEIYNDPWPPKSVLTEDVFSILEESIEAINIEDADLQMSIRISCHKRIALGWQQRQMVHRHALSDRRKRNVFYDSDVAAGNMMRASGSEDSGDASKPLGKTPRKDCIEYIRQSGQQADFGNQLDQLVSKSGWPFKCRANFRDNILLMASSEWTGPEMLEAFRGYTTDTSEIEDFVRSVLQMFEHFTPPSPPEIEMDSTAPASRRSRSSSKVRFEDGLTADDDEHEMRSVTSMSSRSVPVNERWGGFEVPEPEEDIGREVLFQVTREAMNELLDPMFRLREDLWLEAQNSEAIRHYYREAISAAVVQPKQIWEYLHCFLKQQRIKSDYPSENVLHGPTDALMFRKFVRESEASQYNDLTSEMCLNCDDARVFFGQYCGQCRSPSIQVKQRLEDETNTLTVDKCRQCKDIGQSNFVRSGRYCGACGIPSQARGCEDARLWYIISGCDDWSSRGKKSRPHPSQAPKSDSDTPGDDAKTLVEPGSVEGSSIDTLLSKRSTPLTTDSAPLATGNVESAISQIDREPPTSTVTPSTEGEPPSAYPEMALDLHNTVRSFNEKDLSIEEQAAQKPLDELLKEAGYDSVDESALDSKDALLSSPPDVHDPSHTPPPDPTLPQNRPNSIHHSSLNGSAAPPSGSSSAGAEAYVPPSPPPPPPSLQNEEESPDIATLKYWAALYLLEAEDEERGGPGRLSQKEFMEIMLGERGKGLEFLGEWMNLTTF
ncbi:MAG: hypothetical protein Q9164_004381, partial [Protoblastenia rupestris]